MKGKTQWTGLIYFIIISLIAGSCTTSTTSTSTTTKTTASTTITSVSKVVSTAAPSATTSTPTTAGNWWDKLGKPQYGGTLTLETPKDVVNFDPYNAAQLPSILAGWMEPLHTDDWKLDPTIFNYRLNFRPPQYIKGDLATSWEVATPNTYVVHLRQGIHYQNISPVNGREFVADDVVYHYDRLYGLGGGFTKPSPAQATVTAFQDLVSVTTTDKYTVVFTWKTPNPTFIMNTIQQTSTPAMIEASEAVKQWGDLNDWHHAIGTGPFILNDYVSASSATLVKNSNYWGYDERYPQNQLPYVDQIKVLVIPDINTAMAAMRTGKIDEMDALTLNQSLAMQKTNPEILQFTIPAAAANTIDPRNDVAPFKDIKVREAMQMSLDLKTIASTFYAGTADPWPSSLTSNYLSGLGWPYQQWPQDLKDEYAYNPTKAKQLLAAAGFPNGFNTDLVAASDSDLDLAQIVKSYFAAIGINMEIRVMDAASWTSFVYTGRKQDALAQRSIGALGQTNGPLNQLPRLMTGSSYNYLIVSDPVYDAFYPKAMAANTDTAVVQALRDANEEVARQHFAISLLSPNIFSLCQPWLKGFNAQTQSTFTTNGTPGLLSFYGARFWIDQKLKTSLGH